MPEWSRDMVEERITEAAAILRRLPPVRVAGYFGITKANDLESRRTDFGVTSSELNDMRSDARTLFMIADVTGAAAVVVGGVSLYLTLSGMDDGPEKPKAKTGAVRAYVTPRSAGLVGSF